jgi:dihydrofolate reductase
MVDSLDKAIEEGRREEEERIHSNVILNDSEGSQSTRHPGEATTSIGSQEPKEDSIASLQNDNGEVFILGGGQIFTEALPLTDRLYLTIVDHEVPADVFFPEYEKEFTRVIQKEEKTDWEYPYRFLTLER